MPLASAGIASGKVYVELVPFETAFLPTRSVRKLLPYSTVGPPKMKLKLASVDGSTNEPSLLVTANVTVGLLPGATFVTPMIWMLRPWSWADRVGIVCAVTIPASNSFSPCGWWQEAHAESSACGPPLWLAPVAQSMVSWQEPHAAIDG